MLGTTGGQGRPLRAGFLTFILSAMALLSGCLDILESTPDQVSEAALAAKNPEMCNNLKTVTQKDNCINYVASGMGDTKVCDRLKGDNSQDMCRTRVAVNNKDMWSCISIRDNDMKAFCTLEIGSIKVNKVKSSLSKAFGG
jgi:hypothetical protein